MPGYDWWDVTRDGRTRHTMFRMLSAVQEECALFTVPSVTLADRIKYALRTAYEAGKLLGYEPEKVPNYRTDKQHAAPHFTHDWIIPARTYTLPNLDRHSMRTGESYQFARPEITVRTRRLADAVTRELDSARTDGMRTGTDARHYSCHGSYAPHFSRQDARCAKCGRYGQVYVPGEYDANCDRLAMVWLTAEVTDWRDGDKLCAECVASFEWDTAIWDVQPRPDGITLYTHR